MTTIPTAAPAVTAAQIRRTHHVLTAGTWAIIAGTVIYSLMTTTPLVQAHTAPGWEQSAPLLGLMVDVAFVMALQADAVLAQLQADPGRWPAVFRWATGAASVFLNVGQSVRDGDRLGTAIHLIAPALLLLVAEVAPVYRRHLAAALVQVDTTPDTRADTAADTEPIYRPAVSVEPGLGVQVDTGADTEPVQVDTTPDTPPVRLDTAAARAAIEDAYARGLSVREAATLSTRSASYVGQAYARLRADQTSHVPGQLTLVGSTQ